MGFEMCSPRACPASIQAFEVDIHGKPAPRVCYRQSHTRNFWLGLTEDFLRSYDLDGLMFGSERQGPLNSAMAPAMAAPAAPSTVGCFCRYCVRRRAPQGINATARQGSSRRTMDQRLKQGQRRVMARS